mmetsp:Transcript_10910/g.13367  ORF Transcript_10910/g.13367 Transcript_10910/m.13367 type:complete len:82 (-) Transcript_10910:60-305(-)
MMRTSLGMNATSLPVYSFAARLDTTLPNSGSSRLVTTKETATNVSARPVFSSYSILNFQSKLYSGRRIHKLLAYVISFPMV